MSEVRRVLLANGQYIEIVQETGASTGAVMSQNAVTTALNGKANTTHTHAASDITSGTFGSARIADSSITTVKILDKAVTKAKLADDVISSLPASSYETVEVTAIVSDNKPANGLLVSINGVQYTFSSTGKIYAIVPYGQVYSVAPISTTLFNASGGGGTYTASTGNRSVSVSYAFIGYGVYIEDKQGKLYATADWSSGNNTNANSVVLLSGTKNFRIALKQISSSMKMDSYTRARWETYLSGTTNSGITDNTKAITDYNGAANTQLIIEKCQSSTEYAAGACNAYTFPDGVTKGYLPALGELCIASQNKNAVDAALSKCGGVAFPRNYNWSSTFWGSDGVDRYCWMHYWGSVEGFRQDLTGDFYVRAFGAY